MSKKNKRTQTLLHDMDPSNLSENVDSDQERIVHPEFQTDSPTVCVSEMKCPLDKEAEDGFMDEAAEYLFRKLEKTFSETIEKIDASLKESHGWIKMTGGFWYFDPICALLPGEDTLNYTIYRYWPEVSSFTIENQYRACLIRDDELDSVMRSERCPYPWDDANHKYFCASKHGDPTIFLETCHFEMDGGVQSLLYQQIIQDFQGKNDGQFFLACCYNGGRDKPPIYNCTFLPVFHLTGGHAVAMENMPVAHRLVLWALFHLTPESLQDDPTFAEVCDYIRKNPGYIDLKSDSLLDEKAMAAQYRSDEDRMKGVVARLLADKYPPFEIVLRRIAVKNLLICDEKRANIKPEYEEKRLTSPNRGHWDLWGENAEEPDGRAIQVPCEYYARNPRVDIQQGGVVGIDFGTKSTTVVRIIAKEKPKPMRIGHSDFGKLPTDSSDYENPTVMQFIDGHSFLTAYRKRSGRPLTKWNDLTISHMAADKLQETTESDRFPSFLSELKQWAGGNHKLRVKDLRGNVFVLPPFGKLSDDDIDPIEIYAYYIGLNINHMRNGIFMRYEISYPVTYDKDILTRLRASFERGIRKSLPDSILNDAESMKQFRVRFGASEPAAYSLCALKEYGFDPSGDKKIFYGVFDFGGGTTDFDFGTFREATEAEQDEGKDYVLEHFRPSGDKYLGGENILQLIAYEVFKQNRKMLLEKNIPFSKPFERENTSFEGEEGLIDDSPEAHLNMKLVMEKLRPLWENSKETAPGEDQDSESADELDSGTSDSTSAEENQDKKSADELDSDTSDSTSAEEDQDKKSAKELESGTIRVTLFDRTGTQQTDNSLKFDLDELKKKIRTRIKHGVVNFFARLKETFKEPYVPKDLGKINLFLAGNSCKSPLVKEIFEECITSFEKDSKVFKNAFELFPPLGSEEALEKMKERNPKKEVQTGIECPTGKTGVAFGLVMGREGSNYLVIDKNMDSEGNIAFRFYVGKSRKGLFNAILNMTSERKQWKRVISVGSSGMVELQYSDLAEAGTGELPEEKTFPIYCPVNQPDDKNKILFIRVKSANEFEYALADDEASIVKKSIKSIRLD